MHALRFPSMGLARSAGFIKPTNWQNCIGGAPPCDMDIRGLFLHPADTDPRNTADETREVFGAHGAAQANSFKIQAAAIG